MYCLVEVRALDCALSDVTEGRGRPLLILVLMSLSATVIFLVLRRVSLLLRPKPVWSVIMWLANFFTSALFAFFCAIFAASIFAVVGGLKRCRRSARR